jgi:Fur family zinc uptake transcriptional regulator
MPKQARSQAFPAEGHNHKACLADALRQAETACQRRGARLTALRRRVLELVWASHAPVKAYDLLDQLRAEHAKAAPPTVYRALDFLVAEGLIHRIESLNAFIGCAGPTHSHQGQFLICRVCGAAAELNDPEIAALLKEKAARLGFRIDQPTVELKGLCPRCDGEP